MSRVEFIYRTGRVAKMPLRTAKLLTRLGKGTYQHRMMVAEPVAPPALARPLPDLDLMGVEELRALAAERGVQVHHKAGAVRIRQALRDAEQ